MGAKRPQPDRSIRRPAGWIAVLAITLSAIPLAGCGKKHRIVSPVYQPPPYEVPLDPTAVLRNLAKAYGRKDSTEYKSLFDESYQGSSLDQRDPSPVLLTFTKADEAAHIAALAKRPAVVVNLVLVPVLTRTADAGDPPEWAMIQNPIFSLQIYDGSDLWTFSGSDEDMEFHFIPTPDSSSPTDTTWKIIKWIEVGR